MSGDRPPPIPEKAVELDPRSRCPRVCGPSREPGGDYPWRATPPRAYELKDAPPSRALTPHQKLLDRLVDLLRTSACWRSPAHLPSDFTPANNLASTTAYRELKGLDAALRRRARPRIVNGGRNVATPTCRLLLWPETNLECTCLARASRTGVCTPSSTACVARVTRRPSPLVGMVDGSRERTVSQHRSEVAAFQPDGQSRDLSATRGTLLRTAQEVAASYVLGLLRPQVGPPTARKPCASLDLDRGSGREPGGACAGAGRRATEAQRLLDEAESERCRGHAAPGGLSAGGARRPRPCPQGARPALEAPSRCAVDGAYVCIAARPGVPLLSAAGMPRLRSADPRQPRMGAGLPLSAPRPASAARRPSGIPPRRRAYRTSSPTGSTPTPTCVVARARADTRPSAESTLSAPDLTLTPRAASGFAVAVGTVD